MLVVAVDQYDSIFEHDPMINSRHFIHCLATIRLTSFRYGGIVGNELYNVAKIQFMQSINCKTARLSHFSYH